MRTVNDIRKAQEEAREKHGFEQRILDGGYKSKFWQLIKEDMQTRLKHAQKALATTRPSPDSWAEMAYLQAEIHIYEQLLGLENLSAMEEQKKLPGM